MPYREDPLIFLLDALDGNASDAIERQEKRGQEALVNSSELPIRFNYGTRAQLEKFGVVFGEPVDDLFCRVILPAGWKIVPTDHDMWSDLIDNQDRKRAAIFYKAAFYDRRAHINLIRRYSYHYEPVNGYGYNYSQDKWQGVVKDQETIIWHSDPIEPEPEYNGTGKDEDKRDVWLKWDKSRENLAELARYWLQEHYPYFDDPTAYWD